MTLKENMPLNRERRVAVIGAGPAGISAVAAASALGMTVDWFDREGEAGGKIRQYHELFPTRESAPELLGELDRRSMGERIHRHFGQNITRIESEGDFLIVLSDNKIVGSVDAVVVATGFDFFDARRKEEFGYGDYRQVITSPELEERMSAGPEAMQMNGEDPSAVAFVHCVGSRDQQAGIPYCSRLCCITGIKQAIAVRERFPACKVYNFYIDIRAFGSGYEELYREAQEKFLVQFIRGRVSEASENLNKQIVLKAEDTLMARPVRLTVDWLVLLVGMVPAHLPVDLGGGSCVDPLTGFYAPGESLSGKMSLQAGVFAAGACCGPVSIPEAIGAGRSAVMEMYEYLQNR